MKLFALFLLSAINLLGCNSDFLQCQQKSIDANVFTPNYLRLPISKTESILYSNTKINNKTIIKEDTNLHLYLVKDKNPFAFPFEFIDNAHQKVASVTNKEIIVGKIYNHQVGINTLANFSAPIMTPSLIMDECCRVSGISTSSGVIESNYLQSFVTSKKRELAELGFRIQSHNDGVYISEVDCSIKEIAVMIDDKIVSFNHKKVSSASILMNDILTLSIGDKLEMQVLRNGKKEVLHVEVFKRFGGGFLSDTFLEKFGIKFNDTLCLKEDNIAYKLRKGDCLKEVNFTKVKTAEDVRAMMGKCQEKVSLLFERNQFQFFVHPNGGKVPSKFKN